MSSPEERVAATIERTCAADGCAETGGLLHRLCPVHDILSIAKYLTEEQFQAVREALANMSPLTEDERREGRRRFVLARLRENTGRHALEQGRLAGEARENGATDFEIAAAMTPPP